MARNLVPGTQAAENFHRCLVKFADLHLGHPPVVASVAHQHIIGASDVDHRLGRDQERLSDIGAQADVRKHAWAKLIVRIADGEQDPQRAALLGQHGRNRPHLAGERLVGKAEELGLAPLPELHSRHQSLRHVGHDNIHIPSRGAEQVGVQAALLKLPCRRGLRPFGELHRRLGLVNVFASLNLRLNQVGLGRGKVLLRVGARLHELLHPVHQLLLGIDLRVG